MKDEEVRRIFAKNLNYYIALNQKQQIDVAKDLGINASTLNMWCKGNSMPGPGKIRALADYLGIGWSKLTEEERMPDDEYSDATESIGHHDERFKKIIIGYSKLPADKKSLICQFFETFIFKE